MTRFLAVITVVLASGSLPSREAHAQPNLGPLGEMIRYERPKVTPMTLNYVVNLRDTQAKHFDARIVLHKRPPAPNLTDRLNDVTDTMTGRLKNEALAEARKHLGKDVKAKVGKTIYASEVRNYRSKLAGAGYRFYKRLTLGNGWGEVYIKYVKLGTIKGTVTITCRPGISHFGEIALNAKGSISKLQLDREPGVADSPAIQKRVEGVKKRLQLEIAKVKAQLNDRNWKLAAKYKKQIRDKPNSPITVTPRGIPFKWLGSNKRLAITISGTFMEDPGDDF